MNRQCHACVPSHRLILIPMKRLVAFLVFSLVPLLPAEELPVATGRFILAVSHDAKHPELGVATISKSPDGRALMRFTYARAEWSVPVRIRRFELKGGQDPTAVLAFDGHAVSEDEMESVRLSGRSSDGLIVGKLLFNMNAGSRGVPVETASVHTFTLKPLDKLEAE